MRTTLAETAIAAAAAPHRQAHICTDGRWYNPHAGTRTPCPTLGHLTTATEQVTRLGAAVHDAAHNDDAARYVAEGMTGLVMAQVDAESREGWTTTARMAVEALSEWLDRDPALEGRATAALARLTSGQPLEVLDRG